MVRAYVLKGIYPATGKVIQTTLLADTADEAKRRAEKAGLAFVMVHAVLEEQSSRDTSKDIQGSADPRYS
ncbi:MAG: hypothetical protein GIKADHBN_00962 [Phycisphaerales bacterium]|nr:hypothetical protein [Phycisphaerales bacterium]MCK6475261.1 hypothetical protein [Phycisphaerales bacterium]